MIYDKATVRFEKVRPKEGWFTVVAYKGGSYDIMHLSPEASIQLHDELSIILKEEGFLHEPS